MRTSADSGKRCVYRGYRTEHGAFVWVCDVSGDGRAMQPYPLPWRLDLWNHSPTGLEWGYAGSGPAQLALAILADHTGDEVYATAQHQRFKREVTGRLPVEQWEILGEYVAAWVDSHPPRPLPEDRGPGGRGHEATPRDIGGE